MKLLGEKATLIVAGAWNPAIITPHWIGREILGYQPDKQFQVGLQLPLHGIGGAPRFTFEGLSITTTPDSMTFHLDASSPLQVERTFEVAAKILHALSHTPVAALGINISFAVESLEPFLAQTFDCNKCIAEFSGDENAKLVTQTWHAAIKVSDHLINVTCTKSGDGAMFDFNHHYELDGSTKRAEQILSTKALFEQLKAVSESLVDGTVKGNRS